MWWLFQELDSVTQRNNGVYSLGELAKRTLMHATYAPSIDFQGGKYGIGMLSKEKPLGFKRISLPGKEEKRSLLIVEFADYMALLHPPISYKRGSAGIGRDYIRRT